MDSNTRRKKIFIVHGDLHSLHTFSREIQQEDAGAWVYFGTDLILEREISKFLNNYKKIAVGNRLQKTAKELRSAMVDYVGELAVNSKNDCWWLSALSERSPTSSCLFLHVCYLSLGLDLCNDSPCSLVIVCESDGLAEAFQKNLSQTQEYSVRLFHSKWNRFRMRIKNAFRTISAKSWFLIRYFCRMAYSRTEPILHRQEPSLLPGEKIIIHSWVDARSFSEMNQYQDIYFGKLGETLLKQGLDVVYLLDINPTIWFPRAIRAARKCRIPFIPFEAYISTGDLVSCILRVWEIPDQISQIPPFHGKEIQSIVVEELLNERYTSIAEHACLSYFICSRMSRELTIRNFIFTYENQACQKMFSRAFNKNSPGTTTEGYVHTYAIPMYTLYSISSHEKEHMPLPDRIVVNGGQSKNNLVDCGYPEGIIFVGGALRYSYLESHLQEPPAKHSGFRILVAASVNINETVELIEKTVSALSALPDVQIIVKMHPTLPYRKIARFFPVLPDNVSISETPVQEILKETDLVVYTSSTVAIEAVAMGVPVIHVQSDHTIDMNFFDGEKSIPSISDTWSLAETAENILGNAKRLMPAESEDLVRKYFLPVDKTVISLFISRK